VSLAPERSVEAMLDAVVRADSDEMAAAITSEIAALVWPDRCGDTEFCRVLGLSVRDNARALMAALAGTLDVGEADAPTGAFALAELTAELGIPVSELESAYWVGARGLWREWFVRMRATGGRGGEDELDQVRHVTMLIFDYVIHVLSAVTARYDVTRAEMLRNKEDWRRAVLAQILDGTTAHTASDVEQLLSYPLRSTHVAIALEVDDRAKAERAATAMARASGTTPSVVLLYSPGIWMSWLGSCKPLTPACAEALMGAARAAGVRVGLGEPAAGITGLRRTSEQALEIVRLRQRVGAGLPPAVRYADVRLELLLLHDEAGARAFVADELAGLAGYDERSDRTCEAVLLWLASGSQLDAAARLGVHKNTMRLRIAHAEDVLGHRLSQRRPEISVALRLREMLRASA